MKKMMFVLAMLSLSTLCWAGSARDVAMMFILYGLIWESR